MRLVVTSAGDSGPGTLRAALELANSATPNTDVLISFAPSMRGATIRLASPLEIKSGGANITVFGDLDFNPSAESNPDPGADVTISGDTNGDGVAGPGDSALLVVAARDGRVGLASLRFEGGFAEAGPGESAALIRADGDLVIARSEIVGGLVRGGELAATILTRSKLELRDVVIDRQQAIGGTGGGDAVAGVAAIQPVPGKFFGVVLMEGVVFGGRAVGGDAPSTPGGMATVGVSGNANATGVGFAIAKDAAAQGGSGTMQGVATLGHAAEPPNTPLAAGNAGGSGRDVFDRSDEPEAGVVFGLGGDDRITGGFGADTLDGGDGNDTIVSGLSFGGRLIGGAGDDLIFVRVPGVRTDGGRGRNDTVSFVLWEGVEGPRLAGPEDPFGPLIGIERLIGSPLADFLSAPLFVDGRGGNDLLAIHDPGALALGGEGNDTLSAVATGQRLNGGDGDDQLLVAMANGGSVTLEGGAGNDTAFLPFAFARGDIAARDGAFIISVEAETGDAFRFVLRDVENLSILGREFPTSGLLPQRGSARNDEFAGSPVDDTISGGGGADTIFGLEGSDRLRGGAGRDLVEGGDGDDRIHGDAGRDALYGGFGDDTLFGGSGADTLDGGFSTEVGPVRSGVDKLRGGGGADTLIGDGDDTIIGGAGDDRLIFEDGGGLMLGIGGPGRDVFAFVPSVVTGFTAGAIRDFRQGVDRIELVAAGFGELAFNEVPVGPERFRVEINYSGGVVVVRDARIDEFGPSDFIFL